MMREGKVISLKFRKRLHRQDQQIDAVYFPLKSMISLLVMTDGKPQMEMAVIGNEGVVGASEILQTQGALGLHIVQIPGTALRIEALALSKVAADRPSIKDLVTKHLLALTRQILCSAVCNRLHSMEERCA